MRDDDAAVTFEISDRYKDNFSDKKMWILQIISMVAVDGWTVWPRNLNIRVYENEITH